MQLVARRDVTQRAVQTLVVVPPDESRHDPPGIRQRQRRLRTDALRLDRAVIPFQLPVALRIVRAGAYVGHSADPHELLEILGDKLRPVVGDDPRILAPEPLPRPLDDRLHVDLFHLLADLPVHQVAAVAVEDAGQEVERPADVHVGDIHVPVAVGASGLLETFPLAARPAPEPGQQPGPLEHPIHARRADRHHVGIEHHVRQTAIAFQGMLAVVVDDRPLFPVFQPVVARNPAVMLVDFAVPLSPLVVRSLGHAHPAEDLFGRRPGLVGPVADIIDHCVARLVGNPDAV